MVAVGFGLVEIEGEDTPYGYKQLKYRLTDKGVKMLDRLLQRVTMPAEILGNVRTLSSMNTKELLEIARKYERV
jgi:DNA-binding PadR family transcriptional regulator